MPITVMIGGNRFVFDGSMRYLVLPKATMVEVRMEYGCADEKGGNLLLLKIEPKIRQHVLFLREAFGSMWYKLMVHLNHQPASGCRSARYVCNARVGGCTQLSTPTTSMEWRPVAVCFGVNKKSYPN